MDSNYWLDDGDADYLHCFYTVLIGNAPSSEVPAGSYPFMVKSEDGRDVPVVQAYAFGKYLGYLKVTFDGAGTVLKSTGNPILLDSSVPEGKKNNMRTNLVNKDVLRGALFLLFSL